MRRLILTVAAAAALAASVSPSRANILYRETFGTDVTGGQGATQAWDWAVHTTATAVDASSNTATTPAAINRSAGASKPAATDPTGNVNAGAVVGAVPTAYGAGIAFTTPGAGNTLFWTPEYAITSGTGTGIVPAANPGLTFSWYEGNANLDGTWSVAVRVGGQWYVSHQTFANTATVNGATSTTFAAGDDAGNGGTNHGAELKTFAYGTSAALWDLLSFDGTYDMTTHAGASGTVLTRGLPATVDLSGTIDAFGLYGELGAAGNRRFDTYTITNSLSAPEPATALILAAGSLMFVRRRAR